MTAGWRWLAVWLGVALLVTACGITQPAPIQPIVPVRKKAWEASLGGREAAKTHLVARLAHWPRRLTVDASELPLSDEAFLFQLARDTWRGIEAMVDLETGLPIDHLRFTKAPILIGVLGSWGIALIEYFLQVPANRIGYRVLSAYQLKAMQEAITLCVFIGFAALWLGEGLPPRCALSFMLMLAAVAVAFG